MASSWIPGRHWSHSLSRELRSCDRMVFYRLWGSHGGWDPESPPTIRLLYTARTTTDLLAYVGVKVHSAIQHAIHRIRVGMKIPPLPVWDSAFDERMRTQIQFSASRDWLGYYNPRKASLILYEHFVGADLHEWQIDEAIQRAKSAFSSFYSSYLPRISAMHSSQLLLIDSLDKIRFEGFDLFLAPDLVLLDPEKETVIDWKTGVGTNSDQLAAYGWYYRKYAESRDISPRPAMKGWSVPLLALDRVLEVDLTPEVLDTVEPRIRADIVRLLSLAEKKDKGDLAFKKAVDPATCELCRFRFHCDLRPDPELTS